METNLWAVAIPVIAMGVFGGGGLVAYLKNRSDAKRGIHQETRADTDALNARAIAIVESQFQYLVKPLQDKVEGLETKVATLEIEAELQRNKYWGAIRYIRKLYAWASTQPVDRGTMPQPSEDLAKDI